MANLDREEHTGIGSEEDQSSKRTVMENLEKELAEIETEEEFPVEFQCCICLDLLYKPVVLGCGHLSCFWCVFKAMDGWQESCCPLCRDPYNHFPSICRLMHFLLVKLYPIAYKRRKRQVLEEEKKSGFFSPQFDDYLSASSFSTESDNKDASSLHSTTSLHERWHLECGSCEGKTSPIKSSSEINRPDKENTTTTSSYQAMGDVVGQEISMPGDKIAHGTCQRVFITDLLCALCKQLLYRPVVLNCGHVYCEACIINPGSKACSCHLCQSVHPNGFPNVCLVLKHFLEEQFPEEYASRKETVLTMTDCQQGSTSTCSVRAQQEAAKHESLPRNIYSSWWSGREPKVHPEAGCDFCGMCPIIGERYKCIDCLEKIGFDLCEGCYNSSSKLPGRFNQQHKPDHKFMVVQPNFEGTLIWLGPEHSEEDGSNDSEDQEDVSSASNTLDDAPRDLEEGAAPHIP